MSHMLVRQHERTSAENLPGLPAVRRFPIRRPLLSRARRTAQLLPPRDDAQRNDHTFRPPSNSYRADGGIDARIDGGVAPPIGKSLENGWIAMSSDGTKLIVVDLRTLMLRVGKKRRDRLLYTASKIKSNSRVRSKPQDHL